MSSINEVLAGLQAISAEQERVYKDLHAHPELSLQETKTAALAASKLREAGYEVIEGISSIFWISILVAVVSFLLLKGTPESRSSPLKRGASTGSASPLLSLQSGLLTVGYLVAILSIIRVGEKLLQKMGARKPMLMGCAITASGILLTTFTFLLVGQYMFWPLLCLKYGLSVLIID